MPLERFEVLTGIVGTVLILIGVVLLVEFRNLRQSLKRLNAKMMGLKDGAPLGISADALFGESHQILDEKRQRLEDLIREAENLRSDLSVLFYDIKRSMDEVAERKPSDASENEWSREDEVMYPLPEEGEIPPPIPVAEPLRETVLRHFREGRSIQEIASAIGRGEGEVAFILSMERVGRS